MKKLIDEQRILQAELKEDLLQQKRQHTNDDAGHLLLNDTEEDQM